MVVREVMKFRMHYLKKLVGRLSASAGFVTCGPTLRRGDNKAVATQAKFVNTGLLANIHKHPNKPQQHGCRNGESCTAPPCHTRSSTA
jgi:hypothetical protein